MKLLFDENLSYRLPMRLADVIAEGRHVRSTVGRGASDDELARYAQHNGFAIVTCDRRLVIAAAALKEAVLVTDKPPKVIVLRLSNPRLAEAEAFLRHHLEAIRQFMQNEGAYTLELESPAPPS